MANPAEPTSPNPTSPNPTSPNPTSPKTSPKTSRSPQSAARRPKKKVSGGASASGSGRGSSAPPAKPDVEAIMAGIRKTVRERADDGGLTEEEFRIRVGRRAGVMRKGLDEDLNEGFRLRDPSRWNPVLTGGDFHGGASAFARFFRRLVGPLVRLLVDLSPVARQTARQAQINEYYRRLLWAANRDLEQHRLELDLLKRELRRFGVQAEFSFRPPTDSAGGSPPRGGRGGVRDGGDGERGRGERRGGGAGPHPPRDGQRGSGGRPGRPGGNRRRDSGGPRPGRGGGGRQGGGQQGGGRQGGGRQGGGRQGGNRQDGGRPASGPARGSDR